MSILIQLFAILLIIGIVCLFGFAESEKWYAKWPPIDDDEFLLRCPPGTDREVALKVRRIVSDHTGIAYAHIYPEQEFVTDLDCC